MEKSKVLIKSLLNFRQSGDVLFFLNVRRLRGYTATTLHRDVRFIELRIEFQLIPRNWIELKWLVSIDFQSNSLARVVGWLKLFSGNYVIIEGTEETNYLIFAESFLNCLKISNKIFHLREWKKTSDYFKWENKYNQNKTIFVSMMSTAKSHPIRNYFKKLMWWKVRAISAAFKVHVPIVEQLTWYSICRGSIWVSEHKEKFDHQKQKTRKNPLEVWNLNKLWFPK